MLPGRPDRSPVALGFGAVCRGVTVQSFPLSAPESCGRFRGGLAHGALPDTRASSGTLGAKEGPSSMAAEKLSMPCDPCAVKPLASASGMERDWGDRRDGGGNPGTAEAGLGTLRRTGAWRGSGAVGGSGGLAARNVASMCGAKGENRSRRSLSRPPLSGPFLSLLSGHFGFSSPMPLRGRVGPLGKSVFMATRSLSE